MGVRYYGVSTGKFRRYHESTILNIIDLSTLFRNIRDFFNFIKGIFEAKNVLQIERPDVLFAKGGYVSLPVGLAARMLRIPVVIHESDIVMGMANRKLIKSADKVCVSFPVENYQDVPAEKIIETGNPIREDVLMGDGVRLKDSIGFDKKRKTVLILGGSQGSLFINELIMEILEPLLQEHQILWVAGERDVELVEYRVSEIDEKNRKYVKVYGFVGSEIADIYAASDIYIGRAGSNVIFELAAVGLPAIFIPFGAAASAHQFENARLLSRSGAASIFREENATAKKLLHQINYLLSNDEEMAAMSGKIKKWGNIGAADTVARCVYEIGEHSIEQNRKIKQEK